MTWIFMYDTLLSLQILCVFYLDTYGKGIKSSFSEIANLIEACSVKIDYAN